MRRRKRKRNPNLSQGVAAVALIGGALALGTVIYLQSEPAAAAPAKKPTRRPTPTPTPSCDPEMTEDQARALGEKIKADMDDWVTQNPMPAAGNHEGWRAWFSGFTDEAFSLVGPCGSERTEFARDFRRGLMMAWLWAFAASGQMDEEPEDIVKWFGTHPTYDPLDGMPWEVELVGAEAMMPPAPTLDMVPSPTRGAIAGAAAAAGM